METSQAGTWGPMYWESYAWICLAAGLCVTRKTAFVRPWVEITAAECLPHELAVAGRRQQGTQVKCQGFSLIMIIRGEMKASLSTLGSQPLLSMDAITGTDTAW